MVGWQGFEPWTNGLKGDCSILVFQWFIKDDLCRPTICPIFVLFFC